MGAPVAFADFASIDLASVGLRPTPWGAIGFGPTRALYGPCSSAGARVR